MVIIICQLFVRTKIQFFESKSQRKKTSELNAFSCSSEQRYNFLKANHNRLYHRQRQPMLFVRTKIQFFESKSQPYNINFQTAKGCSSEQRYNFLKANHNTFTLNFNTFVLFVRTKIQFFESKSQLFECVHKILFVVRQNKDTIFWKQITTVRGGGGVGWLLFVRTKIQFFESKSQLHYSIGFNFVVVRQNKDTIFWKQITTGRWYEQYNYALFVRTKIQFFESKSQRFVVCISYSSSCSSEQRYNFLKANHNRTL